MPYVDQRRPTPGQGLQSLFRMEPPSLNEPNPRFALYSNLAEVQPQQRTRSYRTGPADHRTIVDSVSNAELYKAVKAEYEVSEYDTGHAFYTDRATYRTTAPENEVIQARADGGSYHSYAYRGPLLPGDRFKFSEGIYYPAIPRLTETEIVEQGTKFIGLTAPTKSAASLSVTLGELLLSALPRMPGLSTIDSIQAKKTARHSMNDKKLDGSPAALAGEYLNIEFGLKPLFGDVKKILRSLYTANEQLRQYHRDSGKVVRRKARANPIISSSFTENWGSPYRDLLDSVGSGFAPFNELHMKYASRESTSRTIYSFSGAYSYHIDLGQSLFDKLDRFEREADLLLGTRVDLDTLWQLTQWSWLVDWFGTIGDTIANIDRFAEDSLVLRYGYLMKHTVSQNIFRVPSVQTFNPVNGINGRLPERQHIFRRETKERVAASPYGFKFTGMDFSSKQWAILAALGMTRGPKSLRGS